jgi:drug/metabolite transporter (DMT)-like permease
MSAATLLVVLASSLGWAALDALRKRLTAHLRPTPLVTVLTLGMLPLFLLWLAARGGARIPSGYLAPAGVAVALNVGANLLFVRALQIAPLSVTVPMLSFTPALTALFSAVVLREFPGARPAAGIALVVAGALVLHAHAAAEHAAAPATGRRRLRDNGPRLMLGVALLWSLVSVVDKAALAHATPALHAAFQCAGVGLAVLALLAARGRLNEVGHVRRAPGTFLAAIAVSTAALGLQFLAFQLTYVSSVEAVKRTLGMIASVVNGRVFFGEPLTARKWAGVLAMALGVTLILV